MRTRLFLCVILGLTWTATSFAGSVRIEEERDVVLAAKWVFVAKVTSYEPWSKECESGVRMTLRSQEVLKGSARDFVDLRYELWWPTAGSDECPSVHYVRPPKASDLRAGAGVIATVVGPNYSSEDAAYSTFDLSRRAELEAWLKGEASKK